MNNGYCIIKKVFTNDVLNDLLELVISYTSGKKNHPHIHFIKNTYNQNILSSAHNLAEAIPFYRDMINHSFFKEIVEIFYDEPKSSHIFNSSYFAKPKSIALKTKEHQDNAYFNYSPAHVCTFWFPLQLSNQDNGGLFYYPLSHEIGDIDHIPEGNLGASMCLDKPTLNKIHEKYIKKYISVDRGDILVHNPLVVHGTEANKSNFSRKAFNFSIATIKAVKNKEKHDKYKKNLDQFLNLKKRTKDIF